jgi:hypothetical protein
MKPDDNPWQNLLALPEPKLAPDFARRVLRQARLRRWRRQFRRRLIAACVFSAALGFVATTVIRVRLAKRNTADPPNAATARSAGAIPKRALKPLDGSGERPESPAADNLVLSEGSSSADDAATRSARGSPKFPNDSSTSKASQTLVLKAPPAREEGAAGALVETLPADPAPASSLQSPPAHSAGLPDATANDAAGGRQPSIHLP